ncbi:MAG: hypothetical protein QME96_01130, partial [Myxococcota bacterium]|nr:hypothetical protein [Myxococcota bacterium]
GAPRDCSALGNQCNTGRCDEAGRRCYADPLPDGTSCDDGRWCTDPDTCTAGTCGGPLRDCSASTNQCNTGTCDDAGRRCYAAPLPNGTSCDDGDPLTSPDICVSGTCRASACGDTYLHTASGEYCDDGNTTTESCTAPPAGACVRDCSIRQDTCGNGTPEPALGEICDDGNADSMDACTTSCIPNDRNVGAPCTCTGGGCSIVNPCGGTINGCGNVVLPAGSCRGCARSGEVSGHGLYFAGGFCLAYAHRCRPSLLCSFAGLPADVGNYNAFVGPCPAGSIFVQQTVSGSGVTLEMKSCQKICDSDSDCRWNEYDSYWRRCGQYECVASPSTPGTRVCFDAQMTAP